MICGEGEGGGVCWIKRKGGWEVWIEGKFKMVCECVSFVLIFLMEIILFVGLKILDEIK